MNRVPMPWWTLLLTRDHGEFSPFNTTQCRLPGSQNHVYSATLSTTAKALTLVRSPLWDLVYYLLEASGEKINGFQSVLMYR